MRFFWWAFLVSAVVMVLFVVWAMVSVERSHPPILVNPSVPLVEDGVAMMMLCGEYPERETVNRTAWAVMRTEVDPYHIGWWSERKRGECVILLHHSSFGAD
jgi:hypothetical protein